MQQLSFNRLGLLIKKQWVENRRSYIISTLSLISVMVVAFVLWLFTSNREGIQEAVIYTIGLIGLFIIGCYFAVDAFKMTQSKDKAIYWISFPASHLEKLLVVLFYNVIVFTLLYIAVFFGLKWIVELYISYLQNYGAYPRPSYARVDWAIKSEFAGPYFAFLFMYFTAQATFILGSIIFRKNVFVTSTIIFIGTLFLLIGLEIQIQNRFFQNGYYLKFLELTHVIDNAKHIYRLNPILQFSFEVFLKYLVPPFLWVITWYKLQEKQVK